MTHEVSVSVSVEILSEVPSKPSRNTVIAEYIKNYLTFKPKTPDLSKIDCSQTKCFTLRFRDDVLHDAFLAECQAQMRNPSNMLTVILATMNQSQ